MIWPSLVLTKRAASLASAAEAATNGRRDGRIRIGSFNLIGCLSWSIHPKKKCPPAWLFALGAL